jgi:hypothetical protein
VEGGARHDVGAPALERALGPPWISSATGGLERSGALTDFSLGHEGPYSALKNILIVGALRLSTKDCSARAASGRL